MSDSRYRLIDFGDGRKLESLAGHLIDRPSPAAEGARRQLPQRWQDNQSVFDASERSWRHRSEWPAMLQVDCGSFRMPLRPTPFGHIGLFPEQAANWQWLQTAVAIPPEEKAALNLFAYTGASTIALAVAGFATAHVDAAKPNVESAKHAAKLNDLSAAPIRYLVDDAAKFAAREVRRRRRYHTLVLDPPAYGHSPGGKAWRIERDLWPLLESCLQLVVPESFRLLVTGHSPQIDVGDVIGFLRETRILSESIRRGLRIDAGRSELTDESQRCLDAGFFVRVTSG